MSQDRNGFVEAFAPAKINLTLHVTGQREDGYHLLDSLVAFADIGDRVRIRPADQMSLRVTGPMAAGVPSGASNLVWKAAEWFGTPPVEIELEKHLPSAAGIGGGSSDAAATLRALSKLFDQPLRAAAETAVLGADVPVCLLAKAARMSGIGEFVQPLQNFPTLHALLVNPRIDVPTGTVFGTMQQKQNAPMPTAFGSWRSAREACLWLADQRNDMEAAALQVAPEIKDTIFLLEESGAPLIRMSGSGATCFALSYSVSHINLALAIIARERPDWWTARCELS